MLNILLGILVAFTLATAAYASGVKVPAPQAPVVVTTPAQPKVERCTLAQCPPEIPQAPFMEKN